MRPDGQVPDELLQRMLDQSYRLVLAGFSRKRQREILGLSACGEDCSACAAYPRQCPGCNACQGKVSTRPRARPVPCMPVL